jgi:hypothetical protein
MAFATGTGGLGKVIDRRAIAENDWRMGSASSEIVMFEHRD